MKTSHRLFRACCLTGLLACATTPRAMLDKDTRPKTAADYVARYAASCPSPPDALWMSFRDSAIAYSTPGLAGRVGPLVDRLEANRAALSQCASLRASAAPQFEVAPNGISLLRSTPVPGCDADACFREVLVVAHVEETVASAVRVAFELKGDTDPACGTEIAVGSLPKEEIREVIRTHRAEVRECYESAIDVWGPFGGRVCTQFVIGNDGAVLSASVVCDDTPVPPVGCCIVSQLTRWRFPKVNGPGTVTVTYPWVLRMTGK